MSLTAENPSEVFQCLAFEPWTLGELYGMSRLRKRPAQTRATGLPKQAKDGVVKLVSFTLAEPYIGSLWIIDYPKYRGDNLSLLLLIFYSI